MACVDNDAFKTNNNDEASIWTQRQRNFDWSYGRRGFQGK